MDKSTPRPTELRDAAIRHVLRPVRGCATDDQYVDASDRLEALLVAAERRTEAFDALVEALRPFVEEFERHVELYLRRGEPRIMQGNFDRMPDYWPVAKFQITMGQCRVARAALALATK